MQIYTKVTLETVLIDLIVVIVISAVRGTMGLVEAIVRNLLENAILYTRPGTEVSLKLSASGLLAVDDRGPGIPAQERNRIFDRFWRGSQTGANGSGLGLAIVKEVADRIGATI